VAMLLIATGAQDADRAGLRIEAIKYGLGFFAAAGAAAALLLAVRRQRLSERAHELELRKQGHAETDARERRVTELYTKAVEQLGSADAAVRLGGLYALERVAQSNPEQRQTVVNVLCAYLRMPYATVIVTEAADGRDPRQELEVRLTAQKILGGHVREGHEQFWPGLDLHLAGATLIDWSLRGAEVRDGQFKGATFSGEADFEQARFAGPAAFDGAAFTGGARFDQATFIGGAGFARARFDDLASLKLANFADRSDFAEAVFGGEVWFQDARLNGQAQFGDATFRGDAWFDGAAFRTGVNFGGATFDGATRFDRTDLAGTARFDGASFGGEVGFERATFGGDAQFNHVTFAREPGLEAAVVVLREGRDDVWPPGWRLVRAGDAGGLVRP